MVVMEEDDRRDYNYTTGEYEYICSICGRLYTHDWCEVAFRMADECCAIENTPGDENGLEA